MTYTRQRSLARFDRQMDMVVHQNIGQELEAELLSVASDQAEIPTPVGIVTKDRPALVPSRDDVVEASQHLEPERASHAGTIIL